MDVPHDGDRAARYDPSAAAAYFAARLAFETDVSDVHDALVRGDRLLLLDVRSRQAWDQGHVPQAVHLPRREIPARAAQVVPPGVPVVVHCWGPGCNGATRAALALARLGHEVREMLGGFEYWVREGLPVQDRTGVRRLPADWLTAPVAGTADAGAAVGAVAPRTGAAVGVAAPACGC